VIRGTGIRLRLLAFITAWTTVISGCSSSDPVAPAALSFRDFLRSSQYPGFSRALKPIPFEFPRDHGAHPAFKNEWWYVTGNLEDPDGRRFGFQFTLFRDALSPQQPDHPSRWATNQIYLAHAAVTDVKDNKSHSDERIARGAIGLAGVSSEPFKAWLEDWQLVDRAQSECASCFAVQLTLATGAFSLDLSLDTTRSAVLHGDSGLSQKSDTPGNASYYYSYTRLRTHGKMRIGEVVYKVQGASWLDHEWSTSSLEESQAGWDWFSVQLSDNSELMLFQLRHRQDSARNYLSGTYRDARGNLFKLGPGAFTIESTGKWTSQETGSVYPAGWNITIPGSGIQLEINPVIQNQELNASFRYWEGAVDISGRRRGRELTGRGYVELTGY